MMTKKLQKLQELCRSIKCIDVVETTHWCKQVPHPMSPLCYASTWFYFSIAVRAIAINNTVVDESTRWSFLDHVVLQLVRGDVFLYTGGHYWWSFLDHVVLQLVGGDVFLYTVLVHLEYYLLLSFTQPASDESPDG